MVTFRDLTPEDLDNLVHWRNDPVVNRYLDDRLKTREEVDAWFSRVKATPLVWLKAILLNDRLIGYGAIESIDEKSRKCEVAIVIGETASWELGIGGTVLRKMLQYVFSERGFHRVVAVVASGNRRSERLITGAGFTFEGTMRDALLIGGAFTDLLCYSMLENEYRT